MITSFDPEYKNTLAVKKGEVKLPEISQLLIQWINNKYGVKAINIYYDKIIPDKHPRIQIIFENSEDIAKFRDNGIGNYLPKKQNEISKKYTELVRELKSNDNYSVENVFVCYSDFSIIYTSNIYLDVSKTELDNLIEKYKSNIIWQIKIEGSMINVFFYTNKEKNNPKNNLMVENLKYEYFSLLKPFDEFGYLKKTWVNRESKEDFDNIYESNWFYWSKDH